MDETADPRTVSKPPPLAGIGPRARRGIVGLVAVLWIAGLVGTALLPWLLVNAPLGLIVLTPALQYVVLAAPLVDPVWLISIATARRVLSLTSIYWLGGLYGERVFRWIESRSSKAAAFVRFFERLIARFGIVVMLVFPIHTVSGLAGASGMKHVRFLVAVTIGQAIQLGATVAFGEIISEWTAPLVALAAEHLLTATLVCVGLVAGHLLFGRWRTGRWGFLVGQVSVTRSERSTS